MPALSLHPTEDACAYDALVAQLPLSSALQGWGFGEARRELGQLPYRFLLQRGQQVVGALQLLRKPLPLGASLLYAPRGPALRDPAVLPDLLPALREWASPRDLSIKIEPPRPVPEGGPIPPAYGPWKRSSSEQPEHTIAVDLERSEEELLARLHPMVRRNLKVAARCGVEVSRESDEGSFEEFFALFEQTNLRSKLGQFPRAYYQTLWDSFGGRGGEAYLVMARHEGRALAGGFFLGMGQGSYYLYGGSLREPKAEGEGGRKDVKAPTAFYWQAMLDARRRGYRLFDFWGIPRVLDPQSHSYGVYRMKENFGGDRLWYPAYDARLSALAAPTYLALRLRKNALNYRQRGTVRDIL